MSQKMNGMLRNTGIMYFLPELIFGVIMTLIFVVAARAHLMEFASKKDFILIVVGMDVTWGIIDAVIILIVIWMSGNGFITSMKLIKSMPEEEAMQELNDVFEDSILDAVEPEDRDEVLRSIYRSRLAQNTTGTEKNRVLKRRHIKLAIFCGLIAACTCLPIVIPVLLVPDMMRGITVGMFIMTAVLLAAGTALGKSIGKNGYIIGLLLTAIMFVLGIMAAFTGG